MSDNKPVVLCILDGFGLGDGGQYDAVAQADAPVWQSIQESAPGAELVTYGLDVGLPEGQMGNSEVGHMNIGAGRVVMQFLTRMDVAFANDEVKDIDVFQALVNKTKENGKTCHLMGLVSDGGVHAHIDHIVGLAKSLSDNGVKTAIHAFTDGRDVPPQSGKAYIEALQDRISGLKGVSIATVSGRYFAMDRDHRWDRVEKAYNAMIKAEGVTAKWPSEAMQASYDQDVTDEFVVPTVIDGYEGFTDGDTILCANFRSDRAREILGAVLESEFDGFDRGARCDVTYAAGMVSYSDVLDQYMHVLFPAVKNEKILGEVLSEAGLTQLRIAETEKYPHVTFFFNSGREEPYVGEDRILVKSPNVATYDLQPEMSAPEVTEKLCEALDADKYDVVILNFANPDMVGHTGDLDAVKKAIEAVDSGLAEIKNVVERKGGTLIVTADHGNADKMWDETTNGPHTAHTTNPVPVYILGLPEGASVKNGRLADLAPTILDILGVDQPREMSGESLIQR